MSENDESRGVASWAATAGGYVTSNLRADDHAPAVSDASLARTRHHMRVTGSVLVEYVEADVDWLTIGDEKVSWSSIWIV